MCPAIAHLRRAKALSAKRPTSPSLEHHAAAFAHEAQGQLDSAQALLAGYHVLSCKRNF